MISDIWNDLANEHSVVHGLLLRRCPTHVVPNVFVALTSPENFKCLAVSVSDRIAIDVSGFSELKDIAVEIASEGPNKGEQFLIFKLVNSHLDDIFAVLCDDLISSVTGLADEPELVRELLDRFEQWKSLFDRAGSNGLGPEAQQGLFGELFFLRIWLQKGTDALNALNCWGGPSGNVRDFQVGKSSVEVKTTRGNNHQRIRISSERQLDRSNLDELFLYHLSLEILRDAGETLNEIVDDILDLLGSQFIALNRFRSKLFEYGYFEHHRDLYKDDGYVVRNESYYEVIGDFPRIEEKDIRPGVGDVKYSIIVSNCENFLVSSERILSSMRVI